MRGIVGKASISMSLSIIDTGEYVKSDGTRLVLHSNGIISDSAVMGQTCEDSHCQVSIVLNR